MKHRFIFAMFLFCFALCPAMVTPVSAENLLEVVDAAQIVIRKKYPERDSLARKMAMEELENTARCGESDEQIIRAIMEKFPETSDELFAKSDLNGNGIPDDWEKTFKVSARFTAPESDEDADGFTLIQEYKAETDPETREMLRIAYLDEAGIPSHGRWGEETEKSFREGNFGC